MNTNENIRSLLLSFALSELSSPVAAHVYKFMSSEAELTYNHELFSMLMAASAESGTDPSVNKKETKRRRLEIFPNNDYDFKVNFRVNQSTMENLLSSIGEIYNHHESACPSVALHKKVLLTCWLLGRKSSFINAANYFGLTEIKAYQSFKEICTKITELSQKYIYWPSAEECTCIRDSFECKYGFPGIVGIIGALHINIKKPQDPDIFYNKELEEHTVILQAVCDDKFMFRDVFTELPGSLSLSHALMGSPFYARLTNKTNPLVEPHTHVLGGPEYPQLATLMTPYSEENNKPLSEQELKFNRLHSSACSTLTTAFSALKKRFPMVQYIDMPMLSHAYQIITSCCVLHNIAILRGDDFEQFIDNILPSEESSTDIYSSSFQKRNLIASFL